MPPLIGEVAQRAGEILLPYCCKLKTTNLKLKKALSSCDSAFFYCFGSSPNHFL